MGSSSWIVQLHSPNRIAGGIAILCSAIWILMTGSALASGTNHDSFTTAPWSGGPALSADLIDQLSTANETRETWLGSPEAESQRQLSSTRFESLTAEEARDLFARKFGDVLAALGINNEDPLNTADEVKGFRSDYVAVVDPAGSRERGLVVSNAPLRSDSGDPIDTSLDLDGGSIEAKSPGTEAVLPVDPAGKFKLSDQNVSLSMDGVAGSAADARLVDSNSQTVSGSELAFYANTFEDTDSAASVVPGGIETFTQIRSNKSPEAFALTVHIPNGARLEQVQRSGISIYNGNDAEIAFIHAPFALDAQGMTVPMTFELDGNKVRMMVEHVGKGFAYPITVDPLMEGRNWYDDINADLSGWGFSQFGTSQYNWNSVCPAALATIDPCNANGNTGKGLYASAQPGNSFPAGSMGYWSWHPPGGTTYIDAAGVTSWRYRQGSSNANPFAFMSLSGGTGWSTTAGGGGGGILLDGTPGVKYFNSGLVAGAAATMPSGNANWRYLRLSTWMVALDDTESPSLGSLNLSQVPSGWIKSLPGGFPIGFTATDGGLGVKQVTALGLLDGPGGGWYGNDYWQHPCSGNWGSQCPATPSQSIQFHPNAVAQGVSTVAVVASDVLGKTSNVQSFNIKVDRKEPTLELTDQLADATDSLGSQTNSDQDTELLTRTNYRLDISADDRNGTKDVAGISRIEIGRNLVPGDFATSTVVYSEDFNCTSGCPATKEHSWDLELEDLQPGEYLLSVKVFDKAGNSTYRFISFDYNPGTGLKDEYVFQYIELPDGSEAAVNVANGNLVYHKLDLREEGADVDLEIERFYNSQSTSNYDSEWGSKWTLGDNPELNVSSEAGPEDEVTLEQQSGSVVPEVEVPEISEDAILSPEAQVSVDRTAEGYELTDLRGENTDVFAEDGSHVATTHINESETNYEYENGVLEEISTSNSYEPESDATAEIESTNGLVDEVTTDSSELSIEHDGQGNLTSATEGSEEVQYDYDGASLLEEIDLDDGTVVDIEYDSDRRVTLLRVSQPGVSPKVWTFSYSTPIIIGGTTTVTEPGGQVTQYHVGASGLVISSQTSLASMGFSLSGSLPAASGQSLANPGEYNVVVNATGGSIANTSVVADGMVADFQECEPTCQSVANEWNVNREALAPGLNTIEARAARSNGESRSEFFTVNVPTNPPEVEEWLPPSLEDALDFRSENGLSTDQTVVSAMQTNPAYWYNKWGLPLTVAEITELQLREDLEAEAQTLLDAYAISQPTAFAGWYMEQTTGIIRVGLTNDSASRLADLRSQFSVPLRLQLFTTAPSTSSQALEAVEDEVNDDWDAGAIPGWVGIMGTAIDIPANQFVVTVEEVTPANTSYLKTNYGTGVQVEVGESERVAYWPDVFTRPLAGGSFTQNNLKVGYACSLGFGARKWSYNDRGKGYWRSLALTAHHCFQDFESQLVVGTEVSVGGKVVAKATKYGRIADDYHYPDFEAVALANKNLMPCSVRIGENGDGRLRVGSVRGESGLKRNMPVRTSGIRTHTTAGRVTVKYRKNGHLMLRTTNEIRHGDSGGALYGQVDGGFGTVSAVGITDAVDKVRGQRIGIFTPVSTIQDIYGIETVSSRQPQCQ